MDGAVGIKGQTSKGDGHVNNANTKETDKMEANLKGGTTFQFVYSFEVGNALQDLQQTEAGREVVQAIKRVEAALEAAKLEQQKKTKVFGGVSRRRNKNTEPSEVEIALRQLEETVNEKYRKVPEPSLPSGCAAVSHDGKEKGEKSDKHQLPQMPTLPVYISNLVTLYRGMVEMALSLEKSQRERTPSPDKDTIKEKTNRTKTKSARHKRVKSVMK